jgi:hypothetical protein
MNFYDDIHDENTKYYSTFVDECNMEKLENKQHIRVEKHKKKVMFKITEIKVRFDKKMYIDLSVENKEDVDKLKD